MATGFDSFNRSSLGAFIRSPLGVRGSALGIIPVDLSGVQVAYSARDFFEGLPTFAQNLTDYACDSGGCTGDPSGTTNVQTGKVEVSELDLADEDSLETADHYITPARNPYDWTVPAPPGTCWGTLRPLRSSSYGLNVIVPRDTLTRPLYFVATGGHPLAANRNTAPPGCGGSWGSTGTPPSTIIYQSIGVGALVNHYHVWKRTTPDSAWVEAAAPWVYPSGYDQLRIQQSRLRMWGRKNSTTVSYWPIETDFNGITPTDISIPSGTLSWYTIWGDWLMMQSTYPGRLYLFWRGSLVGEVGSPHNPSTWNYLDMAFGWLVVTYTGTEYQWWKMEDDGTFHHYQTQEGSFGTANVAGSQYGVAGAYTRLVHFDGAWRNGGELAHIKELSDDGYSWNGTVYQHVWMENGSKDPKGYLAQVF